MKYWRIFVTLFLIFLSGIFFVAYGLNKQLSCQAAPVVDAEISGDSVRISALNADCSFKIPTVFAEITELPLIEVKQKGMQLLTSAADIVLEEAVELGQEAKYLGQALWQDIKNKLGDEEG